MHHRHHHQKQQQQIIGAGTAGHDEDDENSVSVLCELTGPSLTEDSPRRCFELIDLVSDSDSDSDSDTDSDATYFVGEDARGPVIGFGAADEELPGKSHPSDEHQDDLEDRGDVQEPGNEDTDDGEGEEYWECAQRWEDDYSDAEANAAEAGQDHPEDDPSQDSDEGVDAGYSSASQNDT